MMDRKREDDIKMKNQELKDLAYTFECEANRMNEIINARDREILALAEEKNKGKAGIVDLTRNYESEINTLVHEKRRYME